MNSFRKEASEQSKKQQEQYEKSLKILEQRIKEEKDEEKKKLILEEKKKAEELQEKKLKNQKEFDEKMKNTLTFDIDNLLKSFTLNEDNFCKEDISKFDANKINKLIIDLVKEEKIVDYTLHQLNLIMEEIKDKIKDVEHLNIILVGPSGVGKSTLINAILELKTQTLTGFGNPQTQNIEFHTSDKIPFLRLADSKGIEKNESSGVDAVYNSIKDFIKLQIETRDPDKYIIVQRNI
jgi:ATPase subunit of ABC transporter with duplicated ATPase domains